MGLTRGTMTCTTRETIVYTSPCTQYNSPAAFWFVIEHTWERHFFVTKANVLSTQHTESWSNPPGTTVLPRRLTTASLSRVGSTTSRTRSFCTCFPCSSSSSARARPLEVKYCRVLFSLFASLAFGRLSQTQPMQSRGGFLGVLYGDRYQYRC